MNLFDLAATLKLNTSEFENGIKSAQMSAAVFAKEMTKGQVNVGKSLANIGQGMQNVGQKISKFGQGVVKVGKAASVVTAGVGLVLGATFSKAKQFIGTYESAMTVFTRKLAGGKEAAGELYDSLVKVAKGSSFAQEHMVSAGQTLVAMGLDADKTTKYVQAATDAIAGMGGSGAEVEEMATLFAKVSQQTNLYTQDIQQMVERGIPAWDILATKYHTTTDEVKNMASKGLLPAKESLDTITDALEESDEASEMFKYSMHGLAAELKNGTLTGTLDSLNTSFRTFSLRLLDLDPRTESGKKNIEKLNKAISKFGEVLEKVGEKFGKVLGQDLVNGLDAVTNCLENFNNALDNMSPEQAAAIVHAIEAIALAGPALIVVGTTIKWIGDAISGLGTMFTWLSGAVEGASGAWTAFAGAVGGTGAALGIVAAALVVVIGLVVALKRHWKDVVKWFKSFNLAESFSRLGKSVNGLMGKLGKLGDLLEVIGVVVGAVLMPVVAGFMTLMGSLTQVVDGLVTNLGGAIDILAGLGELIIGVFTGNGEKIQQGWNDICNGMLETAKGTVKGILGIFDSSGVFSALLFEPLASSTVAFSDTVSEESQRAVQAYMDLDREATIALNQLNWSSQAVTEDTKNSICKKYDDMKTFVVNKITEQKDETLKVLQDMVTESTALSEDEKQTIINQTAKTYDDSAKKVEDGNNRIKEIMNNASNEKRQLTEDEKKEINRIQEEMKTESVKIISDSAEEQKAIFNDLKLNAGSLTAEQCSEVVKNSKKQMDTTIENAKTEYHDRLKAAQKLREQGGEENEKLADKVEKEAKNQYDSAVDSAKQIHADVVKEAQLQAAEHGQAIDGETGDVLSDWDRMCMGMQQGLADAWNGISEWFINLGPNISGWLSGTWESISGWFADLGANISGWLSGIWGSITGWLSGVWGGLMGWISGLWNSLLGWLSNIWSGIVNWCTNVWNTVKEKWNSIKESITQPIMNAYNQVRSWVDRIKSTVVEKFNSVKSKVMEIWDNVKNTIYDKIKWAQDKVHDIIEKIKGFFNFNISWPHIPLPHFSVSPAGWQIGDLLQGSIPSLSINWYAKGGIFTKPTLFPTSNGLAGVGEAGAEAVLPIKLLKDYVREAMAEGVREAQISYKDSTTGKANAGMINALLSNLNGNEQQINVYIGGKQIASEIYDPLMDIMKKKEVRVGA